MSKIISNKNSPNSINTIDHKEYFIDKEKTVHSTPLYKSWWMLYIIYPIIVGLIVGFIILIFSNNKESMLNKKIQNINSPGSINTIDQIGNNTMIVNPKVPPRIIGSRFVSVVPYQNGYKTQFIVTVGNIEQDFKLDVSTLTVSGIRVLETKVQNTGTRIYENGQISYKDILVSLFTEKELPQNNFSFSVNVKNI